MGFIKFIKIDAVGTEQFNPSNSIRGQIVTERKNKNVKKYYQHLEKIGDGSISTICKVERKQRYRYKKITPEKQNSSKFRDKILSFTSSPASSRSINNSVRNTTYALKTIDLKRVPEYFIEELKNEIEVLKTLDHPNIIRAYETYEKKNNLSLIMQICSGGDLYTRKPYTEKQASKHVRHILRAISYMHNLELMHRDIKFENILFENENVDAEIKLIDFGLSKRFCLDKQMSERVGTIYTMAPQVIQGVYSNSADIWSVGVVTYMLLSGTKPFWGKDRESIVKRIMKCKFTFDGPSWKHVSPEAKSFVSSLLQFEPEDRPTAEQALRSPWLKKEFPTGYFEPCNATVKSIFEGLVKYKDTTCDFKRIALMIIAYNSSIDEIKYIRETFKYMNTSNSGAISRDEFRAAFSTFGKTNEELDEIFNVVDINRNGQIDYTEFLAATIETQGTIEEQRLADAFDRLDHDESGYISKSNLRDILGTKYTKKRVEHLLEESHADTDGHISYQSFHSLILNESEEIVKAEQ